MASIAAARLSVSDFESSAPQLPLAISAMSHVMARGICPRCDQPVFNTEPRTRIGDAYFHLNNCPPITRAVPRGFPAADPPPPPAQPISDGSSAGRLSRAETPTGESLMEELQSLPGIVGFSIERDAPFRILKVGNVLDEHGNDATNMLQIGDRIIRVQGQHVQELGEPGAIQEAIRGIAGSVVDVMVARSIPDQRRETFFNIRALRQVHQSLEQQQRWRDIAAEMGYLPNPHALETVNEDSLKTPLSQSAADGDILGMRMLLAAGASISQRDGNGKTPLEFAVAGAHREAISCLLKAGAPRNERTGPTLLDQALGSDDFSTANLLRSNGAIGFGAPNRRRSVRFPTGSVHDSVEA